MSSENPFIFQYAQVRVPPMPSFLFLHFYYYIIIFSHVSFNMFKHDWKTAFYIYTKCPSNGTFSNTKTHMRDVTECINSIGYALFAVIKAIFSNQNW